MRNIQLLISLDSGLGDAEVVVIYCCMVDCHRGLSERDWSIGFSAVRVACVLASVFFFSMFVEVQNVMVVIDSFPRLQLTQATEESSRLVTALQQARFRS